jgi:hypothetical protein
VMVVPWVMGVAVLAREARRAEAAAAAVLIRGRKVPVEGRRSRGPAARARWLEGLANSTVARWGSPAVETKASVSVGGPATTVVCVSKVQGRATAVPWDRRAAPEVAETVVLELWSVKRTCVSRAMAPSRGATAVKRDLPVARTASAMAASEEPAASTKSARQVEFYPAG